MTRKKLDNLIPHKSMVYRKRDSGVRYMFMGIMDNGKYQLCGMPPFEYEDYLMMNSFEVWGEENE